MKKYVIEGKASISFDATSLDKRDTRHLNDLAADLKYKYADALDRYYKSYGKTPYWWLLGFVCRNTFQDDTFYKICLFYLILEKLDENRYDKIIVDSQDIADALRRYIRNRQINAIICTKESTGSVDTLLHNKLRCLYRKIAEIYALLKHRFYLMPQVRLNSKRPESIDLLIVDILLCSRINGDTYDSRYCADMYDYYNGDAYCSPEIVNNTNYGRKTIEKKINGIKNRKFVFMQEYCRWYDIMRYFSYHRYCCKLLRRRYDICGHDISPIIKNSIRRSKNNYYAISVYCAMKRLATTISIRKAIIWYEARPIDIAVSMALREANVNTERVGYLGYGLSEFMLGQSPIVSQVSEHITPDVISVPGEAYAESIKAFVPEQEVIIAPAFRVKIKEGVNKHKKVRTLLMLMSYFFDESKIMVEIVNEYIRSNPDINLKIQVKMHPVNASRGLELYTNQKLLFEPEYVWGDASDLLSCSDVAFSGKSSAVMDVICSGTYLICLCRLSQLNITHIPPGVGEDRYSLVFDESDFEKAMDEALVFDERSDKSEFNFKDYFVPANDESVKDLFA